ncbi:MAG: chalcone isomerase family protein [Alcaligenes sp.]
MFTPRCAALILSLSLGLTAARAATVANVTVPDMVTVQQQSLKLNGAGLRKKVVFNVYVAALYTASPSQDADTIIQAPGPHQVRMVLKRDLDAQTLIDALKDGIHSNLTDPEKQELAPVIKQFEDLMRQVGQAKEGDIIVLDMNAPQVTILFNDKVLGQLSHPNLPPALLKIWLGKKPAQESLKKALLGLS